MPYPIMSRSEVRSYLLPGEGQAESTPPEVRYSDDGADEDWDGIGEQLAKFLNGLLDTYKPSKGAIGGGDFEAAATAHVHKILPAHPALANPEFWTWLAVIHCKNVIDRRYGEDRDPKNFGVGAATENLLYRLWLRAELSVDDNLTDKYDLARRGDIDFWRSHLFRQGYGNCRTFARALISFQFPSNANDKPRLKIAQIRALAKQLKRARTNLMFELMSEARATSFIDSQWERIASAAA
ncbi:MULTISPECIES: DUF6339 family protein [unclassified Mesorhizobium]|uniref:DUF6339 family protein n=1 Tax=unclassified Mesorhizobium TaxID=325217 RepID=UPI001127715D|nr:MULTISPECIES: DUF6339 family protein [unclassified Mesorhizobium]TPL03742.1 hypothetical protein FJ567_05490 [Mesorhizobium sp. B2-4-16]TPL03759.1 hypothetical protein FJ567_05615 [Mesorhizobium sp. B2-4-16]TPL62323.1 hypothetical protein FJ956_25235 [Mesorhizobium sp. B2-4-3]